MLLLKGFLAEVSEVERDNEVVRFVLKLIFLLFSFNLIFLHVASLDRLFLDTSVLDRIFLEGMLEFSDSFVVVSFHVLSSDVGA